MQTVLNEYLDQEITGSEITFYYHIGDSFSGETDFRLQGDGNYKVWSTVTQGRQRKEYSGKIEFSEVAALAQKMLAVKIWEVKHIRAKPGEDDPQAVIGVLAGEQDYQVILWVSEISQSTPFEEVQRSILDIVYKVSQGEVLEVGR